MNILLHFFLCSSIFGYCRTCYVLNLKVGALPRQQLSPFSPVKRGRGRPRKSFSNSPLSAPGVTGKRKRGRPRKLDSTPRARTTAPKTNVDGSNAKRPRGRPRKYPRPVT